MKTKIILFLALALTGLNGWGQISINPVNNKGTIQSKLEVKQLSLSKWNTQDGIPYSQVPGANLGATSFELLDSNRVAFLCNSTSEIIIINTSDGEATKKFPVIFAPRDFIYDNGLFFVLSERQVIVYDANGKEKNQFSFPNIYLGTERLARFGNATYLLLPSGNSLKIESGGIALSPDEFEGWITSTGAFIKTQLNGGNSYSVKVIQQNGKSLKKDFAADKKVAGVFVVGSTKNRVVLDIQTFISENPIAVERTIVSVNLKEDDIGPIITSIKVPDCYYVLSNKDFCLSANGTILNMVTSPQGLYLFSLTEIKSKVSKGYPESLFNMKYHFNDHLIKVEEK